MTVEQLDRVLAPKLDGALHLHDLTKELDVGLFVLCSSMAATFGGPGQGNYAAANTFLDALAEHRRARGLPGTSVEWGIWEDVGHARTFPGSLDRLMRQVSGSRSFRPFSAEVGFQLFDGAVTTSRPMVLAAPYRIDVIRDEVTAATAPRLMSGLVRSRPRRVTANGNALLKRDEPGAGDPDRRRSIVDETRAQIATALGYESPDSLQMDLSFLELGFDSLVSLELRKRLQSVTGLSLPATMMFDHPTPAALVNYLQGLVDGKDGAGPEPQAHAVAAGGGSSGGTLTGMFRRAHHLGKVQDGIALAEAAARLGPRFGLSHIENQAPTVIPLSRGDKDPILFCFPSLVATSGPHEYARFAKSFQGQRDVVAVPAPGFASNELLPSTLDAVVGAQAAAIKKHAGGRAVAMVGYSTGGLLAYAVATECVRNGFAPTAIVLIDSYTMDTMWRITDPVFDRMLSGEAAAPAVNDETLTAMGAYLGMLSTWTPDEAAVPTLLVKASDPIPGVVRNDDSTATWTLRHTAVEIPGSHLTILEDHADTTALAVEEWLVRHPDSNERRGRLRSLSRARK
jgi:thioesterase domain-containing protein/acyl carrier protein